MRKLENVATFDNNLDFVGGLSFDFFVMNKNLYSTLKSDIFRGCIILQSVRKAIPFDGGRLESPSAHSSRRFQSTSVDWNHLPASVVSLNDGADFKTDITEILNNVP